MLNATHLPEQNNSDLIAFSECVPKLQNGHSNPTRPRGSSKSGRRPCEAPPRLPLNLIRAVTSRKHRTRLSRRVEATKQIGVARQAAHGRFRHAMLPFAASVLGPRPNDPFPCCLLTFHATRKGQVRSASLTCTCGALSNAVANRIEVKHGNGLSRSRQNPT
jgi:hypothetical protein